MDIFNIFHHFFKLFFFQFFFFIVLLFIDIDHRYVCVTEKELGIVVVHERATWSLLAQQGLDCELVGCLGPILDCGAVTSLFRFFRKYSSLMLLLLRLQPTGLTFAPSHPCVVCQHTASIRHWDSFASPFTGDKSLLFVRNESEFWEKRPSVRPLILSA